MSSRILLPPEIEDEFTELEQLLDEHGCRRLNRLRGFLLTAYRELDDAEMQKRRVELDTMERTLTRWP